MWTYIVTWIVVSNFQITEVRYTDAYGVTQVKKELPTNIMEQRKMTKEFDSKKDAIKFIDNCPHNNLRGYYESGSYCIRFKVDSTLKDITIGGSSE